MDVQYEKNYVKPTDPNFVYDKRMSFTKAAADDKAGSDSWDEDEDF
jgi:hypothetical protein